MVHDICVDSQTINRIIMNHISSILWLYDMLDEFSSSKLFLKIDLKNWYRHIRIKLRDE